MSDYFVLLVHQYPAERYRVRTSHRRKALTSPSHGWIRQHVAFRDVPHRRNAAQALGWLRPSGGHHS